LPWDTILYSCIKKSGKTTLNGAITLAWGFTQEPPNEILILANDLEQTLARVFKTITIEGIITHNPNCSGSGVQARTVYLGNGNQRRLRRRRRGLRQCAASIPIPADDFRRMRGHRGPSDAVGLNPNHRGHRWRILGHDLKSVGVAP
jgi:hypothetical protein